MTSKSREELLQGPAGAPPPGVVPNFDNPPNLHRVGDAVLITCFVVATLALLLRVYTKLFLIRQFKISDYSILFAWVVFAGYFAPSWLFGMAAPGVDQWNLRLKDFEAMMFYGLIACVMYGSCIFFIKLSILLQFIEIFAAQMTSQSMYWICHALIWLNFLFYFIITFIEIFLCNPVAKAWDPFIKHGSCMDPLVINVVATSINSLSDIIILALPQMVIWKLHLSWRKKLAVSTVFLIGIFCCVSSVVRLAYSVIFYKSEGNASYHYFLVGLWTIPEMASGILVACLTVSPKFFRSMRQKFSSIGSGSHSSTSLWYTGSRRTPQNYGADDGTGADVPRRGPQSEEHEKYTDFRPLMVTPDRLDADRSRGTDSSV